MTTDVSAGVTVDLITGTDDFRRLEHPWQALYEESPAATPFQSWDWLYSWWETYGRRGALRLLAARIGDRLVGILPLMVDRRRCWCFVGAGLSDHPDVLVAPDVADEAVGAWIERLARSPVDVLVLDDVRPEAAVWRLYARWPGRRGEFHQIFCGELDAAPWDDLVQRWSRNTRKSAKSTVNRLAKGGYTWTEVPPEHAGAVAEEMVALHRAAWTSRPINPAHADPRFATFVRAACERMVPRGTAVLVRFDPPADATDPMRTITMLVVGRGYVGGWLGGENERARERLSIACLDVHRAVQVAVARGVPVVSMLRGLEPGKARLTQRIVPNRRLVLGARGPRATVAWARWAAPTAGSAWLKQWERDSEAGRRVTGALRRLRDRVR